MNKANILRLTVAFATLVTVMIASGQGRPGAVKAPQVPRAAPQVQYTVIDLGTDGVGNQITRLRPDCRLNKLWWAGQGCRLLAHSPEPAD